jgi:hypothetical protein
MHYPDLGIVAAQVEIVAIISRQAIRTAPHVG